MTQSRLGGPGLGLPQPAALYPASLYGASAQPNTAVVALAPGQALPVPAGDYALALGKYTVLQILDPVSSVLWYPYAQSSGETIQVHSDGQNMRIANLTGCPIGAVVTNAGSGYVQASTTVTASAGGSTWLAVVGGAVTSVSVTSAGSGYTVAPIVLIAAPNNLLTPGELQATAYATISSGTVSSITLVDQGAGYPTVPSVLIQPSPYDPNYGSIVNATATVILGGSGQVTAVVCTNNGAPQSTAPTLTISGVGSSAAATATMMWTATGASVSAGGAGYTTATLVTSIGGRPAATPVWTNPNTELQIVQPRPAQMSVAVSGTSITSISTVYDGGLFAGTPTTLVLTNAIATTAATLVLTLGSAPDVSFLQPL